jgi:hypothetical protein
MAGALGSRPPALVVDLGSGDVAVAEQVLHLDDVHVGVKQESGGRRPEGNAGCKCSAGRSSHQRAAPLNKFGFVSVDNNGSSVTGDSVLNEVGAVDIV